MFPGTELGPLASSTYRQYLESVDYAEGVKAAQEHVLESRFFPKLSELRERVARRGCGAPDYDQAWEEVMRFAGAYGRFQTPPWSHPAIASAVKSMGWQDICLSTQGRETLRAQFRDVYKAVATRQQKEETTEKYLSGAGDFSITKLLTRGGHE
jgi:hypothetical protein